MRSLRLFHFRVEDFFFALDLVADFAAGLRAVPFVALGALAGPDPCPDEWAVERPVEPGPECAVECAAGSVVAVVEPLRLCPLDVRCSTTGSATCRRRPVSTFMPVILFQCRN